jgi:membrane-bound lytic murein transglycosylase D
MLILLFSFFSMAQEDTLWTVIGGENTQMGEEDTPLTTEELLSLFDPKKISIPMSYEPLVVTWIDRFKGSHRDAYRNWIKKSGLYDAEIRRLLRTNNLPTDLMFLAMIESGFDPTAESAANAAGLWQFIPKTGKAYGLRIDGVIDERKDPLRATEAAIEHLKDLKLELGYWHIAMAAYNAGTGLIQDSIIRHNTANYWYLCTQGALPQETQEYVPKILAAAILYNDPKLFGISLPSKKSPKTRTMIPFTPKKSTSIATLSEYSNLSVKEFKKWNPHITSTFLPRSQDSVRIYLPPSSRTSFVQHTRKQKVEQDGYNARIPTSESEVNKVQKIDLSAHAHRHLITKGDSVERIAKNHNLSPMDLLRWNQLESMELEVGTYLSLLAPPPKKWIQHTVRKSDTLKILAMEFDCTVEKIMTWNALEEERVPTGKILFIKVDGQ